MTVDVRVLTGEGSVRRGKRLWKPGAPGVVVGRHQLFDNARWVVIGNEHRVLLFADELGEPCPWCDAANYPHSCFNTERIEQIKEEIKVTKTLDPVEENAAFARFTEAWGDEGETDDPAVARRRLDFLDSDPDVQVLLGMSEAQMIELRRQQQARLA